MSPSSQSRFLTRLEHLTFAWFTSSMSLGGIANLLISRIIDSTPLYYLGISLFILNIFYLLLLLLLQTLRFTLTSASVSYTLSHPIECCFIPTALLACATVINGFASVVGSTARDWEIVLRAAFWIYFVASIAVSLLCYTMLFGRAEQSLHHMNPAWVLPIFPLMLCGSVASAVVPTQGEVAALAMAICGLTCQGLGFTLSCMMYSVLLLRLMTVGFPPPRARPGLFMNCGPPAFTIICLLGLSTSMQRILPALPTPLPLPPSTYETLSIVALATSIFLWTIAAWFYLVTLASLLRVAFNKDERNEMEFILAWWACVFPITGWATATWEIGVSLGMEVVKGLARGMVVWLMVVFVAVAVCNVRAVWKGGVMAEGKDEDRVMDTMLARWRNGDEEKGHGEQIGHHSQTKQSEKATEQQQQQVEEETEQDPRSNPPTYPSTPAVSIRRLDMKHKDEKNQDDAEDAIHTLASSTSSSSSSSTSASTSCSSSPWGSSTHISPGSHSLRMTSLT